MIFVIDYGMGNLRSVSKALESLGAAVKVTSDPSELSGAAKAVLPGVGAFGDAMSELHQKGLIEPIQRFVRSKKKLLGICLGLQLLFESSEESPGVEGLGIFKGQVQRFSASAKAKIPHMGWNTVSIEKEHPLLDKVPAGSSFYFVHSFYANPQDTNLTAAACRYAERNFAAMVGNDTVFATQFHPEKSQSSGLQILKNFIRW